MSQLNTIVSQIDESVHKAAVWIDRAESVDFNLVINLESWIPETERPTKLKEIIEPILNFLKDLIDDLIHLLQKAAEGLLQVIDQAERLKILERFTALFFQGLHVLKNMVDSINSLSSTSLLTFGKGNPLFNNFEKVNDFVHTIVNQIPSPVLMQEIMTSIEGIKVGLQNLKAKLV